MPQSTRLEKYRKYRDLIAKLPDQEALHQTDARLLSPQKTPDSEQADDGIRRTTSIPVDDILKATSEISGLPIDDEFDEKRLARRFALKVALICVLAVTILIIIVVWVINGGKL